MGGNDIAGATTNKHTPTAAGSYTVTVSASGCNPKTSAAVVVNSTPGTLSGNITISPSPGSVINIVMTATYSGSETITEWQWKKDGVDIGTNSSTFTPTATGNYTVTASSASHNPKTSAAVTVYGVGSGTAGDPFNVCNVATLQKVGTGTDGWGMDKHYKQVANIDLASVANWTPIGTYSPSNPFTGSYDGNGHTISNLKIPSATDLGVGLFGAIGSGAVVKSVGVNCNITVTVNVVGGVVGMNYGGTVENCYSTGTVSGDSGVGGVVGNNPVPGSTVQNCYSECNVTSTNASFPSNAGGVVGVNGDQYDSGTVRNCYSTGNVSAGSNAGGVVGDNGVAGRTVQNCYATGNVSGTGSSVSVGGVQGYSNGASVVNCVALCPNINGSGSNVRRVAGLTSSTGTADVTNCYGRSDMKRNNTGGGWSSNAGSGDGADITSDDWKLASWWEGKGFTTVNWDFTGINATHLPKLKNMPEGTAAQNPVIQ